MKVTRKTLLELPVRKWGETSTYDSIYIVPTSKKHDSGWMVMAIVGCNDEPIEIAAYCDDICWYIESGAATSYDLRTDCDYPSGIVHVWDSIKSFKVGPSLSSTDVYVIKDDKR